jgi:hypothetical protein
LRWRFGGAIAGSLTLRLVNEEWSEVVNATNEDELLEGNIARLFGARNRWAVNCAA